MTIPAPQIKRLTFDVLEDVEVDGFKLPKGSRYNAYSRRIGVWYMGSIQWMEPDYVIQLTKRTSKP